MTEENCTLKHPVTVETAHAGSLSHMMTFEEILKQNQRTGRVKVMPRVHTVNYQYAQLAYQPQDIVSMCGEIVAPQRVLQDPVWRGFPYKDLSRAIIETFTYDSSKVQRVVTFSSSSTDFLAALTSCSPTIIERQRCYHLVSAYKSITEALVRLEDNAHGAELRRLGFYYDTGMYKLLLQTFEKYYHPQELGNGIH